MDSPHVPRLNRRSALQVSAASALAFAGIPLRGQDPPAATLPVNFALNTSTIRGQKLPIEQQIKVTAQAGYDGIEPWIRDIDQFLESGGALKTLRQRLDDSGLFLASAIGFANWIADDASQRSKGLEVARRDMDRIAQLGGTLIAAPPIGAHRQNDVSPPLEVIAERYRTLCELGAEMGVRPQLELWGFSPTLSKLSELAFVASEAAHPMACVLPDFYHIYKGGNDFQSLQMIEASQMHCFHINDYPDMPGVKEIGDADRVFPGDGVCPLPKLIAQLIGNGFRGSFSLELFNREYWKRDASEVAAEGLRKSRQVVAEAMAILQLTDGGKRD
ncbi:MAG: sugar phosphate isomerase/epimerase family protein [Planctomycetota bacterium]